MTTDVRKLLDAVAGRCGWREGEIRTRRFRHTYCAARIQTLDNGAPVSLYTVARQLGHGGLALVHRVYSHLGEVVVADTSVLINFIHLRRFDLLGARGSFTFAVAEQVVVEVTRSDQTEVLVEAFKQGHLHRGPSTDPAEIGLYAELRRILGRGEAASLAMAEVRGWLLACDERGRFLREPRERLGEKRLINTPGLILLAIRGGHLSVQEADGMKLLLKGRRFKMTFESFGDMV